MLGDYETSWNAPDVSYDVGGWDQPTGWADVAANIPTTEAPNLSDYGFDAQGGTFAPTSFGGDYGPEPGGMPSGLATEPGGGGGGGGEVPRGLVEEPSGSGGGFWGTLGDIAKKVTPGVQLGLQGLGAAQSVYGMVQGAQQQGIQREAQRRQSQIANQQQQQAAMAESRSQPMYGAGREAYERAMRGEVPPSVEQQIQNWRRGATQMANARAASSGQGNSTILAQWQQWIDQQAEAMRGNWVQSQMDYYLKAGQTANQISGTGVSALAGAGKTSGEQVQGAAQQQQSIEGLIQNANQILSRLSASTGK